MSATAWSNVSGVVERNKTDREPRHDLSSWADCRESRPSPTQMWRTIPCPAAVWSHWCRPLTAVGTFRSKDLRLHFAPLTYALVDPWSILLGFTVFRAESVLFVPRAITRSTISSIVPCHAPIFPPRENLLDYWNLIASAQMASHWYPGGRGNALHGTQLSVILLRLRTYPPRLSKPAQLLTT